jgi:hypothetical protein
MKKELELQNRIAEIEEDLREANRKLQAAVLGGSDTGELREKIGRLQSERTALLEALPEAQKKDRKEAVAAEHAKQVEEAETLVTELEAWMPEAKQCREAFYAAAKEFFNALSEFLVFTTTATPTTEKEVMPYYNQVKGDGLCGALAHVLRGASVPSDAEGRPYEAECAINEDRRAFESHVDAALRVARERLKKLQAKT